MTHRARSERSIKNKADLAAWLSDQQQLLHRRIQRMPAGSCEQREARALAAIAGMRKMGQRYRWLKWRLPKGDKNG